MRSRIEKRNEEERDERCVEERQRMKCMCSKNASTGSHSVYGRFMINDGYIGDKRYSLVRCTISPPVVCLLCASSYICLLTSVGVTPLVTTSWW